MKTLFTVVVILLAPSLSLAKPPRLSSRAEALLTAASHPDPGTVTAVARERASSHPTPPHRMTAAERAAARREARAQQAARDSAAREDARYHGGIPRTINDVAATTGASGSWYGTGHGTLDASGNATVNVTLRRTTRGPLDVEGVSRIDTHRALEAALRRPVESGRFVSH